MKLSIVDGIRREPEKGLLGSCIGCGRPTNAKCGTNNIWHWSHKAKFVCDHWWENETEWHRKWKSQFPIEWQEIVHEADDGEKHIADVKTDKNWVLEFQHSFLNPEERRARNEFYKKIVWVVDGTRRQRDKIKFLKAIDEETRPHSSDPLVYKIWIHDCKLFEEWQGPNSAVFFDFGDEDTLWLLLPSSDDIWAYVAKFERKRFIEIHAGVGEPGSKDFQLHIHDLVATVGHKIAVQRVQSQQQDVLQVLRQAQVKRAWQQRYGILYASAPILNLIQNRI